MLHSFFTACLLATFFTLPALAKDIEVSANISEAIVYSDRASVMRSAEIEIPQGSHTLVLKGISIRADVNSLKVEGSSTAKVSFGAVSYKQESSQDYIAPREKELNDLMLKLQDERKLHNADKAALKVGRTFLENLGQKAALRENEDIAKIELNPQEWGNASESLTKQVAENLKNSIALDIKTRDIDDKIRKVRQELQQLRTGQKRSYVVSVPFESSQETSLSFEISYQLPDVGWKPVYDARLDTQTGAMELVQYGSVWQRTGEDWEDIALTLSTAQPSRGASLPELHPDWVSIMRAQPKGVTFSADSSSADMVFSGKNEVSAARSLSMAEEARAVPQMKASLQSAQINTEGFVGEYKITGPADVKADGTQSKLLIGTFKTENKVQLQIKPQYDPLHAYIIAQTKLKGEAPILPGQVNLFRDGAFIGQSYIPMLRPDDETDLGFGIDDNITVTRNMVKDHRSESGMITKDSVLERSFITQIQNLHKEPVEIAVLETVPVSKDERIRVEIIKDETTPDYEMDVKDKKGVMRWVKTWEPKETDKIALGWKVLWPKGEEISGL